jgi:hypothetical protein
MKFRGPQALTDSCGELKGAPSETTTRMRICVVCAILLC